MAITDARDNRYLAGNFAPVPDEHTITELPVDGTIPSELNGRLLRNGPNPIRVDNPATYHWFTGDGMIHGVELRDGRAVSYRNRWVRTDGACEALGETLVPGQPDDVFPLGSSKANTHVIVHARRILALEEAHLPTQLTPELDTVGRFDFDGRLRSPMTAHPKVDPVTGELVFFGYNVFGPPYLRYHVADAAGNLVKSEDITLPAPVMIHDFNVTENHVVWMDLPVVLDLDLAVQGLFPFSWKPDNGARLGVMPRSGGDADVRWVDIEPCYVFHPLNAYEDGDTIVVDVCRYEHMFAGDRNGPSGVSPTLDRWTVDLTSGTVREERLDDRGQEFPRVDDRVVGRRHRYGYASQVEMRDGVQLSAMLKHDLQRGTTEVHDFGAGRVAGEPVFVAAGEHAAEDEGYVLAVVHDEARDASDVVILDATAFAEAPVATVHLPRRVPFGFHGSWVPDAALAPPFS